MIQKCTVKCDRPPYLTGPGQLRTDTANVTGLWSRYKPGTLKMQVTYLNASYVAHMHCLLCF
jgi:hypothetical protein